MSFLTYDTADDIISSLEIIEKLLFPVTDFWHDNYLKCSKTLKKLKVAYGESKKCLKVIQALHKRLRRGEWRRSPWTAQHVNNQWKHWSSEKNWCGESSNHYFPRLKRPMKGQRFATIEKMKTESLRELKDIPKSAYQKCFEDWKKRWHKCIISQGDYFEGDNIEIHEYINIFRKKWKLTLFFQQTSYMIQSTVRCWTLLFSIILAIVGYNLEKTMCLFRWSTNRSIFWLIHKSENADEPGRVPSIETNGRQKEERLESTAGGVRFPISAFLSKSWPISWHVA